MLLLLPLLFPTRKERGTLHSAQDVIGVVL